MITYDHMCRLGTFQDKISTLFLSVIGNGWQSNLFKHPQLALCLLAAVVSLSYLCIKCKVLV